MIARGITIVILKRKHASLTGKQNTWKRALRIVKNFWKFLWHKILMLLCENSLADCRDPHSYCDTLCQCVFSYADVPSEKWNLYLQYDREGDHRLNELPSIILYNFYSIRYFFLTLNRVIPCYNFLRYKKRKAIKACIDIKTRQSNFGVSG